MSDIKDLTNRILEDGVITRSEYNEFLAAVHEDGKIDAAEKEQIDRIYELIKLGKIELEED